MFTFQFLNDKIHNYIFFSHFEGTRGEKNQIFRTQGLLTSLWVWEILRTLMLLLLVTKSHLEKMLPRYVVNFFFVFNQGGI